MQLFILRRAGCGAVFLANALQFNRSQIEVHWMLPRDNCIVLGFTDLRTWLSIRALSDPRMPREDSSTEWLDNRADINWSCSDYLTWERFELAYRRLLLDIGVPIDYDSVALRGYWQDYMTTMGMTSQ
jgi:hypothetical protein